jgi:hypothetical protein
MAVRLSALRSSRHLLIVRIPVLMSVRACADHRATMSLEEKGQLKDPII